MGLIGAVPIDHADSQYEFQIGLGSNSSSKLLLEESSLSTLNFNLDNHQCPVSRSF